MTKRPGDQGVEPASGKDNTTLDAQAWQRWQAGQASAEEIERWQQQLHQQLPQIPQELLDPSLLPIALLHNPSQWSPQDSGLDPIDLLACHRDLTNAKQLLSSGRLGEIALGQRSLFTDLPPVHLQAYRDGLRPAAREGSLSALKHLGGIGRQRFQRGRPKAMNLAVFETNGVLIAIPAGAEHHLRLELKLQQLIRPRCIKDAAIGEPLHLFAVQQKLQWAPRLLQVALQLRQGCIRHLQFDAMGALNLHRRPPKLLMLNDGTINGQ